MHQDEVVDHADVALLPRLSRAQGVNFDLNMDEMTAHQVDSSLVAHGGCVLERLRRHDGAIRERHVLLEIELLRRISELQGDQHP